MQVQLVMFRDGGDHRPFVLRKESTVIGRREDCDLRIAVGDVSRKHCRLILGPDSVEIEDLGSSNGTFVNGTKIQRSPVNAGDTIQIGPVVFVIQVDGQPAVAEATPKTKSSSKSPAAAVDDEIEIDELDILNDSGGDSNIDLIDIDSPKA